MNLWNNDIEIEFFRESLKKFASKVYYLTNLIIFLLCYQKKNLAILLKLQVKKKVTKR